MLTSARGVVCSLRSTCSGHRVLAASPKTGNATRDGQHPEHTTIAGAVGYGGHDDTDRQEEGRQNSTRFASQTVANESEG
jgi:hypothetical protein